MRSLPGLGIALCSCLFLIPSALGAQTGGRDDDGAPHATQTNEATLQKNDTELGLLVFGGVAHDFGGVGDRQFMTFGGRLGRVLTNPFGPGLLRGHFEIAVEVLPVFLMLQETTVYAFSSTLLFRQQLRPDSEVRPFLSAGAGTLFATDPIPPQASSFNFTPQIGLGVAWFRKPGLAYLFEYRFLHISNGGTSHPNPGINSSTFHFGVSLFR